MNQYRTYSSEELTTIQDIVNKYPHLTIREIYPYLKENGIDRSLASISVLVSKRPGLFNRKKSAFVDVKNLEITPIEFSPSSYTKEFKEEVVKFAQKTSVSKAAKVYNISFKAVKNWCTSFNSSPSSLSETLHGIKSSSEELELIQKVITQYPQLFRRSQFMIASKLGYTRCISTFSKYAKLIEAGEFPDLNSENTEN